MFFLGQEIFSLIRNEFETHSIPWQNCIAFGSDNANVMVGKECGVFGYMLKQHSEMYLSGCVCHLIHIAAEKGAASLPFNISQLLVDVFYYLDKSSKRQGDLKCFQLLHDMKETKILKHVATRWLSIGKCLPRLIDSWDALYDFFKSEEKSAKENNTKKKVTHLKEIFGSRTKKLYCLFLRDAIKDFEKINTELQSDTPMIHSLANKLQSFYKTLMIKFVKPSAILGQDILSVNFSDSKNIKDASDLKIGPGAMSFLESVSIKQERKSEFFNHVVLFYQAVCSYMTKKDKLGATKLPFKDPLLQHLTVTDPSTQLTSSFADLEFFLKKFPSLINSSSISDIKNEFPNFQCTDISSIISPRIDTTWFNIWELQENGKQLFTHLPRIMLSLLTIPHSSAHCERIFSVVRKNKTDFRGNMSRDTLEALVVSKSRPGAALDRTYTDKELKELKSAYYRSLQSH